MNTEPPVGDDLERMLVSMKRTVLQRAATTRPRHTRRHVGIAVGVVVALLLGGTGGAFALGIIPQPVAAPTTAPSPFEPPARRTPSSAPLTATPTSTPTATRSATTAARPPFSIDDPSTWTISGNEVGPLALGGRYEAEYDDLRSAYTQRGGNCPANPTLTGWDRAGSPGLSLVERDGKLAGVQLSDYSRSLSAPTGPTTAEGIGVGSSLAQVRATYPDAQYATDRGGIDPSIDPADPPASLPFGGWTIVRGGWHITFVEDDNDPSGLVRAVWIDSTGIPPYELCG